MNGGRAKKWRGFCKAGGTGNSHPAWRLGLYTATALKTAGKVSDEILDKINFAYLDGTELPDGFIFEGVKYSKEDFPSISLDRCEKAVAENNTLVFQPGKYYQFTDEAGKMHILTCT